MDLNKHQIEFPRYDLLTKEIIDFKSKEQYFESFYNSRINLVKHFKGISEKEIKDIAKKILEARVNSKKIKYALSTVECKSITSPHPSPALIQSCGLDFNLIQQECGLITKYKYDNIKIDSTPPKHIIVDSREQKILNLNTPITVKKLDFGDYAVNENLVDGIVIEKKEGSDFVNTLSSGFERFIKELVRSEESSSKLLIVVDNPLSKMLSFNYLPQFKWTKATPAFIFSRLRELLQLFPNVQIVFVDGKQKSAELTKLILGCKKDIFNYDLQYLLDTKMILV